MNRLPILDDHAHLSPSGNGIDAVRQFQRAGGTHLIVSHMPYGLGPIRNRDDWQREFEITCDFAERINRETDVRAFCVVGPYPVELLELSDRLGRDAAVELMREGVIAASELVRDGRAMGLGEVGRPHFTVDPIIFEISNEILRYCMEIARDLDCPVVLHTEHANESNLREFSHMAQAVGLKPRRVIKHYCGIIDPRWITNDLSLSVLSTRENISSAIRQNLDFMMESDFLDDPDRPGAVLSLSTVPKRTKEFFEKEIIDERMWCKIHVENPLAAYGLEIEL